MNHKLAIAALLASSLVVVAQAPASQNLVYVSVSVTSAAGTPIPGLARGQFRLLENGIEQTISVFQEDTRRSEYTLAFSPANAGKDGTWRKLRVTINDPGGNFGRLSIRATAGYYAR